MDPYTKPDAQPLAASLPKTKVGEYFLRFIVTALGIIVGLVVAYIIAAAVGWIPFLC